MAVSTVPRRSSQVRLFARPQGNRHWTDLTSDVQQKMLRLLGAAAEAASRSGRGENRRGGAR